jgi:hypothetical protein
VSTTAVAVAVVKDHQPLLIQAVAVAVVLAK